jgi:hypothetical protein
VIKLTYNSGCRLGNRLYMYAAGRLLARKIGITLRSEPLDGFPRTQDVILGRRMEGIFDKLNGADPIPDWPRIGHLIGKNLEIEHGFVNSRYFVNDRDLIRSWFWIEPDMEVDPDAVLVNVRLREFEELGLALDPRYYTTILNRMGFKKLYVMTDDLDNPYIRLFDEYKPAYVYGNAVDHFRKALAFKRIVMSNSTFCWWFTFVSRATEIYFPMINGGRCGSWCLGGLPDIDLRLDLPEVTTVYNIQNTLGDCPSMTEEQRAEALFFGKKSKTIFMED